MSRIHAAASAVLIALLLLLIGLFSASPASAQYAPEGGFTVTPSVTFAGTTVSVSGYCMVTSTVTVQFDAGPIIGTGTVPPPSPAPAGAPPWQSPPGHTPAWKITNTVTVPSNVPSTATVGLHHLTVRCNGNIIQVLDLTVINRTCNTGGRLAFDNLDGHEGVAPAGTPAPANPTVKGTLTSSSTGLPLARATVRILRASDGSAVSSGIQTDVNGKYYWGTLANGSYKVQFVNLGFVTATTSAFTYNGTVVTKDGALAPAATAPGVQGTVTDATTGQTLDGATVRLWQYPNLYAYVSVPTNNGGQYHFAGVPAGSYLVQFSAPGYASVWYPAAAVRGSATVVAVTTGQTITVDAKLLGQCLGANANSYNQGIGNPPIPSGATFANVAGPAGAVIVGGGAFLLLLNRKRLNAASAIVAGQGFAVAGGDPHDSRMRAFVLHRFGHCYYARVDGGAAGHGLPVPWKGAARADAKLRSLLGRRSWVVAKQTRRRVRQRTS